MMCELAGWGRSTRYHGELLAPHSLGDLHEIQTGLSGYVARGAGRAYGDAGIGLNTTIDMRRLNRMRAFDPEEGLLTVEAGVTLAEVIDALLPRGWFVPAVPGTRFVTVGGMVAADVHGKNHHRSGGFGSHVASLLLLSPSGIAMRCSPQSNREMFDATIGGMGLTGTIVEVTLRLLPVETGWIRQTTIPTADFGSTLEALSEAEREATYAVAWIDASPGRKRLGRGVVFRGEHARAADLPEGTPVFPRRRSSSFSVPFDVPGGALNRRSIDAFNSLYHRKAVSRRKHDLVGWGSYFFPLDAVVNWNRVYGRGGFIQHQCVIPRAAGPQPIADILQRAAAAGQIPTLAVLKSLAHGAGMLSFPLPGLTLALDFRITSDLFSLLNELDEVVVRAGGRLYLAKDTCQSRDTFQAGYPRLAAFEALRRSVGASARLTSRLSARLAIQ